MDETEVIKIISNSFKIKYDMLDEKLPKLNNGERTKDIIFIDISYILKQIENTLDLTKGEESMTTSDVNALVVSILNVGAHYRHYMHRKRLRGNSVFFFCSSLDSFIKYPKMLEKIKTLTTLFPKVFFIPKISEKETKMYSVYVLDALMSYMLSFESMYAFKHEFIVLSDNSLLFQLYNRTPDIYFIRKGEYQPGTIYSRSDIWCKYIVQDTSNAQLREMVESDVLRPEMDKYIIPYISLFGARGDITSATTKIKNIRKNRRVEALYRVMMDNISSLKQTYEVSFSAAFADKLTGTDAYDVYNTRLSLFDASRNTHFRELVPELFAMWGSTLHVSDIDKISEDISNERLDTEWLLEE